MYLHIGAWFTEYMKIEDLSWITRKIDYFKITTSLHCNKNFMTWAPIQCKDKIRRYETPSFLSSMMPNSNIHRENRDSPNLTLFHLRHKYFKNSFFPFAIVECNKSSPFILLNSGLRRVCNKPISFH